MIRDSGSVKLRCALGLGANASRPPGGWRGVLPSRSSSARRAVSAALASSACLASRIFSRRVSRRRSRSGSSSPRLSTERLVLLGIDTLRVGQDRVDLLAQRPNLLRELGLLLDHPLVAHRLIDAFARSLVPSTASTPGPTRPPCLHNRSAPTNSSPNALRWRSRKRAI